MQPALSGPIARMPDVDIDDLKRKNLALQRRIDDMELELQKQKNEVKRAVQALTNLRDILQPLHRVMRMVFGEIETVDIPDAGTPENSSSPKSTSGLSAKWEMLKNKLGGRQAEFIELLQHGPMTAKQLGAAAHCDPRTAYNVVNKMKLDGLVDNSGGKFSLKEL
jgi:hypothetical protein